MSVLILRENTDGSFGGSYGNLEVLVQDRGSKWSYTMLERSSNGGFGCYGTAPELKKVLEKISEHLCQNIRVWVLLSFANTELDEVP